MRKKNEVTEVKGASALDKALAEISEEFKCSVSRFNQQTYEPADRISSGSTGLDVIMGGGWARGRIHEIYGPEGGGKTMQTLLGIVQAQRMGLETAFVDMEHACDLRWAQGFGVDIDKLIFAQPNSGEQALNLVDRLISTGKISMIVVDSVAALIPQAEIDGEIGDAHMGLQARMMGQALRMLSPKVSANNVALVFVNQIRDKIGQWGSPTTTPGGKALKFYASIRLEVRRAAAATNISGDTGLTVGCTQLIKAIKNKTALPYREAKVPVHFLKGVRVLEDIQNVAEDCKLITIGKKIAYNGNLEALKGKEFSNLSELLSALSDPVVLESFRAETLEMAMKVTG